MLGALVVGVTELVEMVRSTSAMLWYDEDNVGMLMVGFAGAQASQKGIQPSGFVFARNMFCKGVP